MLDHTRQASTRTSAALCFEHSMPTLFPAPTQGGHRMLKGIIAALALGLAAPAFAQSEVGKDIKDGAKDAVDSTKDALGTDSGATKAKRHLDRAGRHGKRKVRHAGNNVKAKL